MKIRMIYSNFDEETGISTVTINTDYGQFTATSKLHEEDRQISSHFAGCKYAEMKAIIMYMRKRIEVINYEITGLENCKKVLEGKKEYNHNSIENRTIRKQIYLLKKSKKMWQERLVSLRDKMLLNMEQRAKIVQDIMNKKEDK